MVVIQFFHGHFSTHILTRRMTKKAHTIREPSQFFNSHPHEEDDTDWIQVGADLIFSTHILTRRMTGES